MSRYRFGGFELDVSDRQLWRGDTRVELSARYFDVLVLLVQNHNTLIDKERMFEEVWKDVVVSDSALSQCIKEIRKQLHDDASAPRFVQTVPRHGYRFIADVQVVSSQELPSLPPPLIRETQVQPEREQRLILTLLNRPHCAGKNTFMS